VATLAVTGRFDLIDGQWAMLEPLLPVGKKPRRPSEWTKQQLIEGIRWRVRVVRAVAGRAAPFTAPDRRCLGCSGPGDVPEFWQQIVTVLQARADAADLITSDVSVDSTTAQWRSVTAPERSTDPLAARRGRGFKSGLRRVPGMSDVAGKPLM
jgi:hypothetical protein